MKVLLTRWCACVGIAFGIQKIDGTSFEKGIRGTFVIPVTFILVFTHSESALPSNQPQFYFVFFFSFFPRSDEMNGSKKKKVSEI